MDYAAIMNGLAKEMNVLSLQGMTLESSLSGLSMRACAEPELLRDLQMVDALVQHLTELRRFTSSLAEGIGERDAHCLDKALNAINLHAVQGRLAEAVGRAASRHAIADSSDFELL